MQGSIRSATFKKKMKQKRGSNLEQNNHKST